MTTVGEAAAERIADIETILRLMQKHGWTTLTITAEGFVLSGDDKSRTSIYGTRKEDSE